MLSTDTSGTVAGPLVSAVQWVQGALLGSIATAIAVIAVAAIGFLMLTGRVDLRRGATVIVGCFVLFGASTIAAALQSSVQGGAPVIVEAVPGVTPPLVAVPQPPPQVPAQSDLMPVLSSRGIAGLSVGRGSFQTYMERPWQSAIECSYRRREGYRLS